MGASMENLLRKLDLTTLRLFTAVCEEKSISRAAEREFIAHSAVSRRLAEMEALVGMPLVTRHARGVTLTQAGTTVLRHANQIIASVEAMSAELSRLHAGMQGKVRIVANLSAIVQFLPEDVAAFKRLFPDVDIDIEEQHSPDVVRLVGEHAADFGICNRRDDAGGLRHLPYRRDRLAVMLPAGHPAGNRLQIAFEDLVEENFVGLTERSALTQLLAQKADLIGASLKVKIRVASLDALCRMVHAGLGIAILPQQVAELYLQSLNIAVVPLADDWAHREICVLCNDEDQLSATAQALVRFLTRPE